MLRETDAQLSHLQSPGSPLCQKPLLHPASTEADTHASDIDAAIARVTKDIKPAAPTTTCSFKKADNSNIALDPSGIGAPRANVSTPEIQEFQPSDDEYGNSCGVNKEDNAEQSDRCIEHDQRDNESMSKSHQMISSPTQAQLEELVKLVNTTDDVYWALLLEPVDGTTYRRVGIAMLYNYALELESPAFTEFRIV